MKASELRLGNLVSISGIDVIVTISVLSQHEDFEPIPLTEEWLLKFDITQKEFDCYVLSDNYWGILIVFDEEKDLWNVNVRDEYSISEIKHVHQLQNLYFALTGEELTIKEVA